jgi:hypothetical protein
MARQRDCASTRRGSSSFLLAILILVLGPTVALARVTGVDQLTVEVTLTGDAVTPPVSTTAVGECTGRVVPSTRELDLVCTNDVAGADDIVLAVGAVGTGGAELYDIGDGAVAGVELILTEEELVALLAGEVYVAVTSASHPSGEIAARLIGRAPIGTQVMRFPLRADALANSGSDSLGSCALFIDESNTDFQLVCRHDVANPTQLRLIIDGGTVRTFGNVQSPFQVELGDLASNFARFLDGDFGLLLTSAAFPAGDIGVVLDKCIEGPTTLCLGQDRFRVDIEFTAPGDPPAQARVVQPRSGDSGLFWFFTPGNWEALVKVLNACSFHTSFWVFLSANTDVAFTVTVYDTLTGRVRTYSNAQGNLAAPVADTAAFPCS